MSARIVRPERPGDECAIRRLIESALACDLAQALAAEAAGEIVGHVAFSPVTLSDGSPGWFGLGPVSVLPGRQHEGIGSGLICEGLARLCRRGAQGCVVLGDPGCYERFGFVPDPALTYPGPPPEYFLRRVWSGREPAGEVRYAAAFR